MNFEEGLVKTKKIKKRKVIKRNNDLNYLIIKDRKGKSIIRKIVYSRVIGNFLLIILQILIIALFVLRLERYLEYYFGISIVLSAACLVYLSNCKTKNEFKIAWMAPLMIMPLFAIIAYLIYHTNWSQYRIGKKLKKIDEELKSYNPKPELAEKTLKNYPEVLGLGKYLLNLGGYFPSDDSRLTYYKSGEVFFPVLIEELKKAEEFIFIEFFILEVDDSWGEILKILEQKAKKGVNIRVLCDGFGSPMASSKSYQKYMKEHGIDFKVFLPLIPFFSTHLNNRDHRKIVVVDGKVAFTGGVNISNEYFNRDHKRFAYWKDNAVKIEGQAIQNLTAMFLQTWNISSTSKENYEKYLKRNYDFFNSQEIVAQKEDNQKGSTQEESTQEKITQEGKTQKKRGLLIPYGDDVFNQEDIAESVYLYIINNAKKYLYITTPYMIIDNQLQDALIFAAKRGVDVKIIVPDVYDHFLTFCIGKTYLKTLVDNGICINLYKKGFIHEKTFVCDDKIATVGSINLDYRSLFHHFECGVLIYKNDSIKEIKADVENTLSESSPMEKKDYKKLPLHYRLIGRMLRIFSPLL